MTPLMTQGEMWRWFAEQTDDADEWAFWVTFSDMMFDAARVQWIRGDRGERVA